MKRTKDMASSHKPEDSKESSKKVEEQPNGRKPWTGGLSEQLEQLEQMCKASPDSGVSEDCENKKTQPWRSRRVHSLEGEGKTGSSKNGAGSPWPPRQRALRAQLPSLRTPFTEWQETNNLRNCLQEILRNPMYEIGDRLSPEDDVKVRSVLLYHLKVEEKTGPGIDYIKIDQVYDENTRCFWVVRVDGTAVDFSYHKCLKARAAAECPEILQHYTPRDMDFSTWTSADPT